MLGRTGGRIGSNLYPTEGKAAGIWRLSEIYNEQRFRLWPPELNGGQSTLNLMPVGTIVELNGEHVRFGGYAIHTCSHIIFATALKVSNFSFLEFNQTSVQFGPAVKSFKCGHTKFGFYKVNSGSLS